MQKSTINIILIVVVILAVIITITALVLSRTDKSGNGGNGNGGNNWNNGSGNSGGDTQGKKVYANGRTISILNDYPTKLGLFFGNVPKEICILPVNFEPAPIFEAVISDPLGDGIDYYKIKINPSPCMGYSHGYVISNSVTLR